ncbi:MAG: chromosome segregation protein SMC [Clostridia bacterium]
MQLKKVELNGFKSFANKTELTFPNGITTIVGPNGSGKSNISDAVRWVLGEQSAKNLRGGKMEDVIFAGTQNRKMVGFAEVSLTIANTSGKLPVDYAEVEVTRRLYRSGESQYSINKNQCRLKDVQELFMDTGVGKDGYSIIGQGKIDEVLSSKSEERRGLFEEAAGIVKYKARKNEAEKKLASAEDNINRVTDILNEIGANIEPLCEQAKVARRYLEIKEKMKYADVCIFIEDIGQNVAKISEYSSLLEVAETDLNKEEEKGVYIEETKAETKQKVAELLEKIEQLQEEYFTLKNEIAERKIKVDSDLEKVDVNNEKIDNTLNEIEEDQAKIEKVKSDIELRNVKKSNLEENKLKFQNELDEKNKIFLELSKNMDEDQAKIEDVKTNITGISEQNIEDRANIKSLDAQIDSSEKRIIHIDTNLRAKISEQDGYTIELEEHGLEVSSKNAVYKVKEDKVNELILEKETKVADLKEEEKNRYELKSKIEKKIQERNMYIAMESQNEGYSRSVKSVLEYAKENKSVCGTVASIFTTDEKYEIAIEALLGGYMQNIVVDNEETAKACINYLKANSLGRATFLPLSTVRCSSKEINKKAKNENGYIGCAANLVFADKKYAKVIELGLSNSIVVDNIDNAVKMAKAIGYTSKIVTLDGEILTQVGSMSGGSTSVKSSGIVGRSKKIETLKEKIEELEKESLALNDVYNIKNNLVIEIEEKLKIANEEFIEVKLDKATLVQKLDNIKTKIENVKVHKDNLIAEKDALLVKIETSRNDIHILEEQIKAREEEAEKMQLAVDNYAKYNKDKTYEIDVLKEDITDLRISLSSFDESKLSIDEMIDIFKTDIKNIETAIEKKEEDIYRLKLENSEIQHAKDNLDNVFEQYSNKLKAKEDEISNLKASKDSLNEQIEKFDQDYKNSLKSIESLKEERMRILNKKEKLDNLVEGYKNKMWDEYEITLNKAKEIFETSQEQILLIKAENPNIKKLADTLKAEIKTMGNVNVSAIQEYAEVKERFEFLTNQKGDLEHTKQKLLDLIDNMISIMKKQFKAQFQIINENFNEVFNSLFEGGKANLALTDETNILECGIEIEVQPPGKKLQNMTLLSGGERALTAIALLFAILKIKAPPFCILDEIEAALDDVNVQRFAKYIKKYSDNTQFVVITHRKGTMEAAKTVYGVTMQEYGISNVVSMKMK